MALTEDEKNHLRTVWDYPETAFDFLPDAYCRAVIAADKRAAKTGVTGE